MKELPVTSTKEADVVEFDEDAEEEEALDLLEDEERRPLIDKLFPGGDQKDDYVTRCFKFWLVRGYCKKDSIKLKRVKTCYVNLICTKNDAF